MSESYLLFLRFTMHSENYLILRGVIFCFRGSVSGFVATDTLNKDGNLQRHYMIADHSLLDARLCRQLQSREMRILLKSLKDFRSRIRQFIRQLIMQPVLQFDPLLSLMLTKDLENRGARG